MMKINGFIIMKGGVEPDIIQLSGEYTRKIIHKKGARIW